MCVLRSVSSGNIWPSRSDGFQVMSLLVSSSPPEPASPVVFSHLCDKWAIIGLECVTETMIDCTTFIKDVLNIVIMVLNIYGATHLGKRASYMTSAKSLVGLTLVKSLRDLTNLLIKFALCY